MENMKLACSEVYCILEILGDTYKNKLPEKFLAFINQNRNTDYSLNINENEYENLNISKDGLVLISFLNLRYWVEDEEEKQRLINIYKSNDEKKQEKINEYKQPNWLNQTKDEINKIAKTNENIQIENNTVNNQNEDKLNEEIENKQSEQKNELIEIKKFSIFDKIKKIIKKFFYKKKE